MTPAYPSPWKAHAAGDQHPTSCTDPSWSPWGSVHHPVTFGRICGKCGHWEFHEEQTPEAS